MAKKDCCSYKEKASNQGLFRIDHQCDGDEEESFNTVTDLRENDQCFAGENLGKGKTIKYLKMILI